MNWKEILKNEPFYRPEAHNKKAHAKAIEEGKQAFIDKDNLQRKNIRGGPENYPSPNRKYDGDMHNYDTKQGRKEDFSKTKPDGTPLTLREQMQQLKDRGEETRRTDAGNKARAIRDNESKQ